MKKDESKIGTKWSYDTENRKPLPRSEIKSIPDVYEWRATSTYTQTVKDAWKWACDMFPAHHGPPTDTKLSDIIKRMKPFVLTTRQAEAALNHFVKHRLSKFGTYEDAVPLPEDSTFVYHSNLSHALNNGLLRPQRLLDEVEKWYSSHTSQECLAQAEGCIRQVLGWREFTRMAAAFDRKWLWKSNGLHPKKKLNDAWYCGTLNNPPVDSTIQKAFHTGYLHHIERLMIMSNYMTISQIHPKQMYQWFMEFAMDSYDWVMILNVFSMGAHADLGVAFTKPYVSSSNYILNMTHYTSPNTKNNWTEEWDRKYY